MSLAFSQSALSSVLVREKAGADTAIANTKVITARLFITAGTMNSKRSPNRTGSAWLPDLSRRGRSHALVGDHALPYAAFNESVKRRPGKLITLRQKARAGPTPGVLAIERRSTRRHVKLKFSTLIRTRPRSAGCAALHASKLVFAGSFSLSFL